jgi:hypothetical protein
MRVLNNEQKTTLRVIGLIYTLFLMAILIGCSKDQALTGMTDESAGIESKSSVGINQVIHLAGTTHFPAYALKEHLVISPGETNCLNCEATLTHLGGQDYLLETVESFPGVTFRKISFEVRMTPSGSLKFKWPAAWQELDFTTMELVPNTMQITEQIYMHTGIDLYGGAGVNQGTILYNGYFDGARFHAAINVIGKQEVFGTVYPFYTSPPLTQLIQGPVRLNFSVELEVVD